MIIESTTEGDFEGTDDEVVYKLDNGQTWQQVGYSYSYSYRPRVKIDTSTSPAIMHVDRFRYPIKVRRID